MNSYSISVNPTFEELFEFVGKANSLAAERDAFKSTAGALLIIGTISVVALSIFNLYAGILAFIGFGCAVSFCEHMVQEKQAKFATFLEVFNEAVKITGYKIPRIEAKVAGRGSRYYTNQGIDQFKLIECPLY